MRYRAPWDLEEAIAAKALRDARVPDEEIARRHGRTVAGVRRALVRFFGPEARLINHGYEVGPAIGKTIEDKRLESDAQLGSRALGEAINGLLFRMDAKTRAICLGADRQAIPGTERVYRGQGAERAFARPIGEIIAPIVADIMDKAA